MCHKIHRQAKRLEGLTTRFEFFVIILGLNNSYAWFGWRLDLDDDVAADEKTSVNSQLHHCTYQKVDH